MELTIAQEALLSALQVVSRAVATKSTMPVLTGVFLRASAPDRLYLAATDMDSGIALTTTAQVHTEGAVVLPARIMGEAVRRVPAGNLNLSTDPANFVTTMTWGARSSFAIHGIEPEQFPTLPEPREEWGIRVKSEDLRTMIRQTSFAASQNESRPILSGLLLEFKDGELWMVAVDYSRMALRSLALGGQEKPGQHRAVVPARILSEVARLLGGDGETVQVAFSGSHAFFTIGGMTVMSRLLDGQFPAYEQFIPENFIATAVIETGKFLETCERAALLSTDEDRTMKMQLEAERILVTAATPDVGMFEEEVVVQVTGDPLEVAFNVKFLQDILRNVSSERVVFQATGTESAAAITMENREDFVCVLMPIRIRGGA
ncbi:MAG: DNA polymerase III subunit beta [Bacillota bacterium]